MNFKKEHTCILVPQAQEELGRKKKKDICYVLLLKH